MNNKRQRKLNESDDSVFYAEKYTCSKKKYTSAGYVVVINISYARAVFGFQFSQSIRGHGVYSQSGRT